ncbi:MAG: DUF4123 domain-containing protein [Bryobacterales bacterium]|jgi:hypothetical protein|nr:DUF4123 domain-containing protein [Bryobacterales bacterium]
MAAPHEELENLLFGDAAQNVFAVIDGASVPDLRYKLREMDPPQVCLYQGELEPDMEEVAPYLVQLEQDTDFAEWILKGWGKHWGVFALTSGSLRDLRQHFRKFTVVYDEKGNPMYFRFYDPRVLRVYAPTCTGEELETLFGPVDAYLLEGEEPAVAVRLQRGGGALSQSAVRLDGK